MDAYTDDGSGYFELWAGIPRTFFADDDVTLAPGESRTWTEYWLPLPGTGGLSAASSDAALFRAVNGDALDMTAFSAVGRDAVIVLKYNETVLKRREYTFRPGDVLVDRLSLQELGLQNIRTEDVQLEMQDANGNVIVVTR